MPNTATNPIASATGSTVANSTSNNTLVLAQAVLTSLGWRDQTADIQNQESAYQSAVLQLKDAIMDYEAEPTYWHREKLLEIIDREVERIQSEIKTLKSKQNYYQKQLTQEEKTKNKASTIGKLAYWLQGNVKYFFGSDSASQLERYKNFIALREKQVNQIDQYRNLLENIVKNKGTRHINSNLNFETSPTQRRLLTYTGSSEFQVNTYVTNAQQNPAIAAQVNGNFIITWESNGQDGSNNGIYAQRFSSDGTKIGNEILVNTGTTGDQNSPDITVLSTGDIVITWVSSNDIYAQRISTTGAKLGSEISVTLTASFDNHPAIAAQTNGEFVVTWDKYYIYNVEVNEYYYSICAQRFSSAGTAIGTQLDVRTDLYSVFNPKVGVQSNGDFIITWSQFDGNGFDIYAKRFSANGSPLTSDFRVNTYTTNIQQYPVLCVLSSSDFVIAWDSFSQDGSDYGIYAQRFSSSASKLGSEFLVNTLTASGQQNSAIATLSNDEFVITWRSFNQDGSDYGIYAQRFSSNGSKLGSEFLVNTYTSGAQSLPAITSLPMGNYVITWNSVNQDSSAEGVYSRIFHYEPDSSSTGSSTIIGSSSSGSNLLASSSSGNNAPLGNNNESPQSEESGISPVIIGGGAGGVVALGLAGFFAVKKCKRKSANNSTNTPVKLDPPPINPNNNNKNPEIQLASITVTNSTTKSSDIELALKVNANQTPEPASNSSYVPLASEANKSAQVKPVLQSISVDDVPIVIPVHIADSAVNAVKNHDKTSEAKSNDTEVKIEEPRKNSEVTNRKASSPSISVSISIKYEDIKFDKLIGRGGFGEVYSATWRHTPVAVKKLLADPTDSVLQELRTETQIMAQLRSPYIVQFYGSCIENPPYCLVMEYMPKGSLFKMLHSGATLDWAVRYQIIQDVSCGIAFLHAENVLHRGLKSMNVLLDNNTHAKLTDFGLSKLKVESRSTTKSNDSVGTLAWMAPELHSRKAKYTQKSDIFSLGVTFWEIASRKIPFADAANPALIPTWISQGDREDIPAECPKKIASLIKFCWDQNADKRPTAEKVVNYLRSEADDFEKFNVASAPQASAEITIESEEYYNNLASQPAAAAAASYRGNLESNVLRK